MTITETPATVRRYGFSAVETDCLARYPRDGSSFSAAVTTIQTTWSGAARRYLDESGLTETSKRIYGTTLKAVGVALPTCNHLSCLTPQSLDEALATAYGSAMPATWNRVVSTIRSFLTWAETSYPVPGGLTESLPPRRVVEARSAPSPDVLAFCFDTALPIRDRALWCLVYDTRLTGQTCLELDVEAVDLLQHRVLLPSGYAYWRQFTSRLLLEVMGSRTSGPLFLSGRTSVTARLSYRRAAEACRVYTGLSLGDFRRAGEEALKQMGTPIEVIRSRGNGRGPSITDRAQHR